MNIFVYLPTYLVIIIYFYFRLNAIVFYFFTLSFSPYFLLLHLSPNFYFWSHPRRNNDIINQNNKNLRKPLKINLKNLRILKLKWNTRLWLGPMHGKKWRPFQVGSWAGKSKNELSSYKHSGHLSDPRLTIYSAVLASARFKREFFHLRFYSWLFYLFSLQSYSIIKTNNTFYRNQKKIFCIKCLVCVWSILLFYNCWNYKYSIVFYYLPDPLELWNRMTRLHKLKKNTFFKKFLSSWISLKRPCSYLIHFRLCFSSL